ncbi:MAG: sigma 54-interacting transcriptional regulator [Acidobacteriota bacterium]
MKPKLLAITGPLEGQIFEIGPAAFSIGRLSSNNLQLHQASVSRRHCEIRRESDDWILSDLESRQGTFVNGSPIEHHVLEHADYVKISASLFLVLLQDDTEEDSTNPVALIDGDYPAESTVQMSAADSVELGPRRLLAFLRPAERNERQLETLLQVSTAIQSIRGIEPLARRLMELIAEVIPAQRTAILLTDKAGELGEVYSVDRTSGGRPFRPSHSTAERAIREGLAILSNDVSREREFEAAESLHQAQIQSLICVPLLRPGRALGALYADTCSAGDRFNALHLRLMTVVATIAAAAFDSARHLEWLEGENRRLRAAELEHDMVGASEPMQKVYQFIGRVALTDVTVLIRGESGTGKELAARAIHRNSSRTEKPFVAINCAVLNEALLESELFGHKRGAFTNAINDKAGKFEIADGGTLFLDEVGEIPLALQAKLLRALEEQTFERVGSNREIQVDLRVIAATNRDLEGAIEQGEFREDLFYRLNVISLQLPPLRERRADIPALAEHFAQRASQRVGRRIDGMTSDALACLRSYDWPGNVRELVNAIEHAVVLGQTDRIHPEDLPETVIESRSAEGSAPTTYHEAVNEAKREILREALDATGWRFVKAAKRLGLHRNYLHRLVRKLGLKPPSDP